MRRSWPPRGIKRHPLKACSWHGVGVSSNLSNKQNK